MDLSPRTPSTSNHPIQSRHPSSTGTNLNDSFLRKRVISSSFLSPTNIHQQQDHDRDDASRLLPPIPSSAPSAPISNSARKSSFFAGESKSSLDLNHVLREGGSEIKGGLTTSRSAASLGIGLLGSTINSVRSLSQGTRWFRSSLNSMDSINDVAQGGGVKDRDGKTKTSQSLGEPLDLSFGNRNRSHHTNDDEEEEGESIRVIQSGNIMLEKAQFDEKRNGVDGNGNGKGDGDGNDDHLHRRDDYDSDANEIDEYSIRSINNHNHNLQDDDDNPSSIRNPFDDPTSSSSEQHYLNNNSSSSSRFKRNNSLKATKAHNLNLEDDGSTSVRRSNSEKIKERNFSNNRFLRESSLKRAEFDHQQRERESNNKNQHQYEENDGNGPNQSRSRTSTTLGLLDQSFSDRDPGSSLNRNNSKSSNYDKRIISSTSKGAPRNSVAARKSIVDHDDDDDENQRNTPTASELDSGLNHGLRRGSTVSFESISDNGKRPGSNSGTGMENHQSNNNPYRGSTFNKNDNLLKPNNASNLSIPNNQLNPSNSNLSFNSSNKPFSVSLNASHSSLLSTNSVQSALSELGASLRWSQKFPEGKHMSRAKSRKSLLNLSSSSTGVGENGLERGKSTISFGNDVNPSNERAPGSNFGIGVGSSSSSSFSGGGGGGLNRRPSSRMKLSEMRNGLRFLAKDKLQVLDDGDDQIRERNGFQDVDDVGRRAKWNNFKICLFISVVILLLIGLLGVIAALLTWSRSWERAEVSIVADTDIVICESCLFTLDDGKEYINL